VEGVVSERADEIRKPADPIACLKRESGRHIPLRAFRTTQDNFFSLIHLKPLLDELSTQLDLSALCGNEVIGKSRLICFNFRVPRMSGRKITIFILLGLLSIVVIIPIWAQDPNPTAVTTQIPTPICRPITDKLSGMWYRQADGYVVAATFTQDELKIGLALKASETQINITLTADH
jgi:hypothetical protein